MKIWTLLALISTRKRRKQLDLQSGQQNANAKDNLNANGPKGFLLCLSTVVMAIVFFSQSMNT